jgi:predicted ribosome quality control (RQC) complex YloA/Tae2 family protein
VGRYEDDLDALFARPLDEFTRARNELAKRLAKGGEADAAAEVRKLSKPTVPAWAVNQLVRREPALLGRLLEGGEVLQEQVLRGSGGAEALRDAQQRERQAVRDLVERAEGLLRDAGRPATAQMRERISETLTAGAQTPEGREALRAGRLSEELEPAGFEALLGMAAPRKPARRKASTTDELAEARRARQERDRERRRLRDELRKLERRAGAAERAAEEAREAAERARRDVDEAARALAELD